MSATNHTRGPWIAVDGGVLEGDLLITTQDRLDNGLVPIVEIETDWEGAFGIEQEANAKLIEAAPDLYEAATLAVTELETLEREMQGIAPEAVSKALPLLRAAIAKATRT